MSKPIKEVVRQECLNLLNEYVQPLYADSVEPNSSECCQRVLNTVTIINGEVSKIQRQLQEVKRKLDTNQNNEDEEDNNDGEQPNLKDLEEDLERIWDGLDEVQKKSPKAPSTMLDKVLDSLGDQVGSSAKWLPTLVRTISDFFTRQKLQDLQYTMSILNKQMKDLENALKSPRKDGLAEKIADSEANIKNAISAMNDDLFRAIQACCVTLNSKVDGLADSLDLIKGDTSDISVLSGKVNDLSTSAENVLSAVNDLSAKADGQASKLNEIHADTRGIKEVTDAIHADTSSMTGQGGALEQITNELRQIKLGLP